MDCRRSTWAAVIALATAGAAHGAIIDTLDNTGNFSGAFGGATATANGNGTVTITRNTASVDTGVNWKPGGQNITLAGNEVLTVTPTAPVNGGYWVPTILLFDSSGAFLGEKPWLGDTQATTPQTVNVADFATTNGISNAGQYFLRIRIDPFGTAGAAFTFDQIQAAAVPEPASLGVLWLGAAGLLAARRRRRS